MAKRAPPPLTAAAAKIVLKAGVKMAKASMWLTVLWTNRNRRLPNDLPTDSEWEDSYSDTYVDSYSSVSRNNDGENLSYEQADSRSESLQDHLYGS